MNCLITSQDYTCEPRHYRVFQGDCLSLVVFNTVLNTFIYTLYTRLVLSYTLSDSTRQVNILQYADDTCL